MSTSRDTVGLEISGLGIIIYSPFAMANVPEGCDYFAARFSTAEDVARHVNQCRVAAIGTGSPGRFELAVTTGAPPAQASLEADAFIRMGIEVRDDLVCIRDLYDMMEWTNVCPDLQRLNIRTGFYRIAVFTSLPESRIIGDNQRIGVHFEEVAELPSLGWQGGPDLSAYLE